MSRVEYRTYVEVGLGPLSKVVPPWLIPPHQEYHAFNKI